eukprot:SAG31_NODE_399_length_16247_cov_19.137540_13_plen_191_part_00
MLRDYAVASPCALQQSSPALVRLTTSLKAPAKRADKKEHGELVSLDGRFRLSHSSRRTSPESYIKCDAISKSVLARKGDTVAENPNFFFTAVRVFRPRRICNRSKMRSALWNRSALHRAELSMRFETPQSCTLTACIFRAPQSMLLFFSKRSYLPDNTSRTVTLTRLSGGFSAAAAAAWRSYDHVSGQVP